MIVRVRLGIELGLFGAEVGSTWLGLDLETCRIRWERDDSQETCLREKREHWLSLQFLNCSWFFLCVLMFDRFYMNFVLKSILIWLLIEFQNTIFKNKKCFRFFSYNNLLICSIGYMEKTRNKKSVWVFLLNFPKSNKTNH